MPECRAFLAHRGHDPVAATGERVERHRVREAPLAVDMYQERAVDGLAVPLELRRPVWKSTSELDHEI